MSALFEGKKKKLKMTLPRTEILLFPIHEIYSFYAVDNLNKRTVNLRNFAADANVTNKPKAQISFMTTTTIIRMFYMYTLDLIAIDLHKI